jgi:hypothetical protein
MNQLLNVLAEAKSLLVLYFIVDFFRSEESTLNYGMSILPTTIYLSVGLVKAYLFPGKENIQSRQAHYVTHVFYTVAALILPMSMHWPLSTDWCIVWFIFVVANVLGSAGHYFRIPWIHRGEVHVNLLSIMGFTHLFESSPADAYRVNESHLWIHALFQIINMGLLTWGSMNICDFDDSRTAGSAQYQSIGLSMLVVVAYMAWRIFGGNIAVYLVVPFVLTFTLLAFTEQDVGQMPRNARGMLQGTADNIGGFALDRALAGHRGDKVVSVPDGIYHAHVFGHASVLERLNDHFLWRNWTCDVQKENVTLSATHIVCRHRRLWSVSAIEAFGTKNEFVLDIGDNKSVFVSKRSIL